MIEMLEGIRVLDLSGYITALYAATLLHEQGIRIGNRGTNACVILIVEAKNSPPRGRGILNENLPRGERGRPSVPTRDAKEARSVRRQPLFDAEDAHCLGKGID